MGTAIRNNIGLHQIYWNSLGTINPEFVQYLRDLRVGNMSVLRLLDWVVVLREKL